MIKQIIKGPGMNDLALLTNGMVEVIPINEGNPLQEFLLMDIEEIACMDRDLIYRTLDGKIHVHTLEFISSSFPQFRPIQYPPTFLKGIYTKLATSCVSIYALTSSDKVVSSNWPLDTRVSRTKNPLGLPPTYDIQGLRDSVAYKDSEGYWNVYGRDLLGGFLSVPPKLICWDEMKSCGINTPARVITCTDTHKVIIHKKLESTQISYPCIFPGETVKKVLIQNLAWVLCESGNLYKCPDQQIMVGSSQDIVQPHKLAGTYDAIFKGNSTIYRIRNGLIECESRKVRVPEYLTYKS